MPLRKGRKGSKKSFRKAVAFNMHELKHNGRRKRSFKQIVAISLSAARGKRKK